MRRYKLVTRSGAQREFWTKWGAMRTAGRLVKLGTVSSLYRREPTRGWTYAGTIPSPR